MNAAYVVRGTAGLNGAPLLCGAYPRRRGTIHTSPDPETCRRTSRYRRRSKNRPGKAHLRRATHGRPGISISADLRGAPSLSIRDRRAGAAPPPKGFNPAPPTGGRAPVV